MYPMLFVAVTSLLSAQADGTPGSIDLSARWRFRPDPEHTGVAEDWQSPSHDDGDWAVLEAGARWEDQGFPDVDGYAWYRKNVDVPAAWQGKNVWLVLGGVNDACVVYCNGERINAYGDKDEHSVHGTPLIADVTPVVRCGEFNLIAVECYDWGASGGLWRLPCILTSDPAQLPLESLLACYSEYDARKITADVDLTGLGNELPEATARVALYRADNGRVLGEQHLSLQPRSAVASVSFDVPNAEPGQVYSMTVHVEGSQGKPVLELPMEANVEWPESAQWPGRYADLKVLNNFVTELYQGTIDASGNITFLNPRTGWVFISMSGSPGAHTFVNEQAEPLVWRVNPDSGTVEAMQFLPEGEHSVTVKADAAARLEIRAVPELAFCYYPSGQHIKPYGPYDWACVERYVLPHVNTLIARSAIPEAEFRQWLSEGRRWISNAGLPGLSSEQAPTPDEVYDVWAQNPGVTKPGYAGMIVDEFLWSGIDHYRAWGEAVRRLHGTSGFNGKTFYAWCGDLFGLAPSLEFSRRLVEFGDRFAWEKYLPEEPTPERARRHMLREVAHAFAKWKKVMPGIERHMVMCLGYLSAPPESLNRDPEVDYHAFLDMQFQMLATEPVFAGLYGVMEYMAAYADEESIRWAHKLFRHYCIEGHRTPLVTTPYRLPHLKNPDFTDGLAHWQVEPADKDSIGMGEMEGFSWLQGRYPRTTQGDRFCRMTRSAKAPNSIRQTMGALEPGRLYSIKLISADLQQLDKEQILPLRIDIEGAEVIDEYGFQTMFPSCYSHEVESYNAQHPAYFNFHRVVFRPEGGTVDLIISDWAAPDDPGGPAGQEIGFNFVEVQPFLEP